LFPTCVCLCLSIVQQKSLLEPLPVAEPSFNEILKNVLEDPRSERSLSFLCN
jgi:hypothetical protein